jgi:hypothetical protein
MMERCPKKILRTIHFDEMGEDLAKDHFLKNSAIFALPPPKKHHSFRPPTV